MLTQTNPTRNARRLLRLPVVLDRYPVARATFLAGVKNGLYPKPVRLGKRSVAWREEDIEALIESRPEACDVRR